MKEERILINNVEVNYKVAGEGQPILILHGWGGSSDSWIEVQRMLAEKGFKIICPDFPGFGKSRTPPQPWGIEDFSNFVLNFTENLKLRSFFLIGHSFGGRVAIRFSKEYPQKLNRLILCNAAGVKPKPSFKTRIIYLTAKLGNFLFSKRPLAKFKDEARNLFYNFLRHQDYAKADGTMRQTIKKILNEDLLPELSQIKTETLLIWGERDKMVPVKYAHIFKKNIANSELVILPKIGHSPHLEIPENLSKIILDFLKINKNYRAQ